MMSYVTKQKRIPALCICAALLLIMLVSCLCVSTYAASSQVEIALVIDDSGSMANTDPDKLTIEAINKFVDRMPSNNISAAIATYDIDVRNKLGLGQDADGIRGFSASKIFRDGALTDAATGVNWAVGQLVNSGDPNSQKAIILIGDGENDLGMRSADDSNNMLAGAINNATSNGINIFTLAINPQTDEFRNYFSDIANKTGGVAYEPKDAAMVDNNLSEIFKKIIPAGGNGQNINPPPIPAHDSVTCDFDVPDGVFEMNLQCDHQNPLDISFKDPNGNDYDKATSTVKYVQGNNYTNVKVMQPVAGKWTVTFTNTSDQEQKVSPELILYSDLIITLSKNQTEIKQKMPVRYTTVVNAKGTDVTDANQLSVFDVSLVVTEIGKDGNPGKSDKIKIGVENGQLSTEHSIDKKGKYEIHAELNGSNDVVKSNSLEIEVLKGGFIETWMILAAVIGLLLLLVIIFIIINSLRNADGSDYVRGFVSVKIVGRQINDEMMIFPNDKFSCEQVFVKKNTLSDLIREYTKRYRIINSGELAEMTLNQFINSALYEVSDKISICGNKKKKTIVRIPTGYEMQVDGMDIIKPKALIFNSPERAIEIRFKNQGCSYAISLIFTKA